MKKFALITLAVGMLANISSAAAWSPSLQIQLLKTLVDGRCIFTSSNSWNAGRNWLFDATTTSGKNMLTTLLAAKTGGLQVKFYETTQVTGLNWYYVDQIELQ